MTIAVDFDGTIVEHRYPSIGQELPFAIETLKKLTEEGHRLILWTVREGKLLEDAVSFCHERGLDFYAVNRDYPEEEKDRNNHFSRKLKADIWIDDRNLGGGIHNCGNQDSQHDGVHRFFVGKNAKIRYVEREVASRLKDDDNDVFAIYKIK